MSWLGRLFGGPADPLPRDPSADHWWEPVGTGSIAGERVTLEKALQLPVVFACLKVISDTIGSLPHGVFERRGDERSPVPNHPLADVFAAPNEEMTGFEFFALTAFDLASAGNAFWEVVPGPRGPVDRLERMAPEDVTVERLPSGARRYRHRAEGRPERILLEDRVWHVRDMPLVRGLVGMSRIDAGREAIGAAMGAQRYSAQFWRNDATPPVAIMMAAPFKDAESRKNYMAAIRAWWGGNNRHSPAVFDHAEDVKTLGTAPEQAQFIETRKEHDYALARLWRMPPHKIGMLERATNNNIEHQSLEFVMDTLRPWLELIEAAVDRWLIVNSRRFYFEFNVLGLLRGDAKTRFDAYAQARQWGWLSINEIRRLENMNPIANGDQHLQPMNMQPAGTAPAAPSALLGPGGKPLALAGGGIWKEAAAPDGGEAAELRREP